MFSVLVPTPKQKGAMALSEIAARARNLARLHGLSEVVTQLAPMNEQRVTFATVS